MATITKIANLDDKNKEVLRTFWQNIFFKEYVDALLDSDEIVPPKAEKPKVKKTTKKKRKPAPIESRFEILDL